eukprot:364631-Chlamydomonas_euryale.AAC.22
MTLQPAGLPGRVTTHAGHPQLLQLEAFSLPGGAPSYICYNFTNTASSVAVFTVVRASSTPSTIKKGSEHCCKREIRLFAAAASIKRQTQKLAVGLAIRRGGGGRPPF